MLTLYFSPGSSSMAPHIALHEIGVPFESRPLSFAKREQRTPEFLALNPEGKVPTLVVDSRPLTEVAGILFYLGRRFPETRLLPIGDEAEAQVVSWCPSSLRRYIRRGGRDSIMRERFMPSQIVSSVETLGLSAPIPLRTFISFVCSGDL